MRPSIGIRRANITGPLTCWALEISIAFSSNGGAASDKSPPAPGSGGTSGSVSNHRPVLNETESPTKTELPLTHSQKQRINHRLQPRHWKT